MKYIVHENNMFKISNKHVLNGHLWVLHSFTGSVENYESFKGFPFHSLGPWQFHLVLPSFHSWIFGTGFFFGEPRKQVAAGRPIRSPGTRNGWNLEWPVLHRKGQVEKKKKKKRCENGHAKANQYWTSCRFLKKKRKLNGKSEMSTRLHASLWKSVSKKKLGKKKTSNPSIVSKRRVIRVDFLVFRVEM